MEFGDPRLPERFWDKVYPEPNTGCWLWGGAERNSGYGAWREVDGSNGRAHVSAYLAAGGVLFPDEVVRHDCDVPACCNPAHLRAGTQLDNILDAFRRGRRHAKPVRLRVGRPDIKRLWVTCSYGHDFTPENTRLKPNASCRDGVERVCIQCSMRRNQELAARRKAARAARTVGV